MYKLRDKILTSQVLIEKAPFFVYSKDDRYSYALLVRKCVSIKEVIDGLTIGIDWRDKRNLWNNISHDVKPKEYYCIVKGYKHSDLGRSFRISNCIKIKDDKNKTFIR